jgi:EmrB/QacA subfamily drug resistance transporter
MADEREKKVILIVASLASFLVPYTGSSITVALPAIGAQFGLDAVMLGWITAAYIISAAVFIVPFGRLSDIIGRKRVFLWGVAIFTVAAFLSFLAPSPGFLILARFIQGIGGAMLFATSTAIVAQVFPPGERGRALGITVAAVYAGLSIGPFLGGILTDAFGWRFIFLINVPIGLVAIILAVRGIHGEWADAGEKKFDLLGSFLYGIMLFSGIFGLVSLPDPVAFLYLATGFITLFVFLWYEQRCTSPVLDVGIFLQNRTFTFSNIAAMINYGATYAVAFLLSLYLQYVRGFSAEFAGLILVAQPVVQTIFSPVAGRLSDRIEPRIVATAGMAMMTLGLLVFIFLSPDTSLALIVCTLLWLGLGYALFSSPNTNAIMSSVKKEYLGIASGMVATMRSIGQVLSMAIAMLCFSVYLGTETIPSLNLPGFMTAVRISFFIFTLLCALGIFASYVRGTIR